MVHYMTTLQQAAAPTTGRATTSDTIAPEDDIRMELAAMLAVGTAIGQLRERGARLRVLGWAMERFHCDAPNASKAASRPRAACQTDPSVAMDNFDGLFHEDGPAAGVDRRSDQPEPELDSLVEDFVVDFQRFASQVQGASHGA